MFFCRVPFVSNVSASERQAQSLVHYKGDGLGDTGLDVCQMFVKCSIVLDFAASPSQPIKYLEDAKSHLYVVAPNVQSSRCYT